MKIQNSARVGEDKIKELHIRRGVLEEKIDAIRADFKRGLDKDASDRAVELENAEVLNEILQVTQNQLAKINEELFAMGEH